MKTPHLVNLLQQRESGLGSALGGLPHTNHSLIKEIERWSEDDFLEHSSAHYSTFNPPPRSTIAVSYNADGTLLASSQ